MGKKRADTTGFRDLVQQNATELYPAKANLFQLKKFGFLRKFREIWLMSRINIVFSIVCNSVTDVTVGLESWWNIGFIVVLVLYKL